MARGAHQLLVSPEFFIVHVTLSAESVHLAATPFHEQSGGTADLTQSAAELTLQLDSGNHKAWLGGLGGTDQNADHWKHSNLELLKELNAHVLQPANLTESKNVGWMEIYPPSVLRQPAAYAWALGPQESFCTAENATWGFCQPATGKNAVCNEDTWTCPVASNTIGRRPVVSIAGAFLRLLP